MRVVKYFTAEKIFNCDKKKNKMGTHSPTVWGPYFWSFLLHPAGQVVPEILSEEEGQQLQYCIQHVCDYLPCGPCGWHCKHHTQKEEEVPVFKTRQEVWAYLHRFHNKVNERNQKIQPNDAEALMLLKQTYEMRGVNWEKLTHTWLFEYWFILKNTAVVMMYDPAKGKDQDNIVNPTRFHDWWKWVRSTCYAWPFAYHREGMREKLLKFIDDVVAYECVDDKDVHDLLVRWQNTFADEFGVSPLTTESFQQEFLKIYDAKNFTMVFWANQRLEEANKKLLALQQELNKQNRVDPVSGQDWKTIALVMIGLSIVLFVMLVILFLYYRFYLACGYNRNTTLKKSGWNNSVH